jgi:DNA-binding protein H-NS
MATLEAIQARIQKLQVQADSLRRKSKQSVIAKIHDLMLKNELTLEDIGNPTARTSKVTKAAKAKKASVAPTAKGKLPAKYLNPKTGETWSGHARPPAWIKDVKDRSKFLIAQDETSAAAAPAAKRHLKVVPTSASSGQSRKKATVAPKYRDPESGVTWTGRGMAPLWIRDAEDRTQFLIEKAA